MKYLVLAFLLLVGLRITLDILFGGAGILAHSPFIIVRGINILIDGGILAIVGILMRLHHQNQKKRRK